MKKYYIVEKFTNCLKDKIGLKKCWKLLIFDNFDDIPKECKEQCEIHFLPGYIWANNKKEVKQKYLQTEWCKK